MIGLSFLGPTKYLKARYYWNNKNQNLLEHETDLFPEVIPKFFRVEKLLVFVTGEVEKHENCKKLKNILGETMELVNIPSGKTEEELWEIFSIVAEHIPEDTAIIMDITHAFRSLPLIVFNIATYLRRIKNVKVERIIYGNFEARDTNYTPPRVPIFDLTSTLDLQDWLHGIDAFQRRGDAEELANSLSRTQGHPYRARTKGENLKDLPQNLKNTALQLQSFSEALRLLRPLDATFHAANVHVLLEKVQDEALQWAKPFADILQDLDEDIYPLQNKNSGFLNKDNLQAQLALIHYYFDKDLIVQTVLLAREWLISAIMLRTNRLEKWRNRNERVAVEKELGLIVKVAFRKQNDKNYNGLPNWYGKDSQSNSISHIWNMLLNLRNDMAHCAMNTNAASSGTIRNNTKNLIPALEALLDF